MFIVQESFDEFDLIVATADHIITKRHKHDRPEQFKIPKPDILGKTKDKVQVKKMENNHITCIELSKDNQYIAVTTENKQLIVFNKTFEVIKNLVLPRVSSKVCFSLTNDILVADRTGDVYLYKISDDKTEPVLLLGHLSVILDMLITPCGKYIITCDRDEKIRVSHYPNAYNIATYCLGHTEFVTVLKLLKCNILLSSSGDGTVRMWNYLEGKQINIINTNNLADENALRRFMSEMDLEKVDVSVLPIADIQVHDKESKVILIVSLYSIDKLFMYTIDSNTLESNHIETVSTNTINFYYYLCNRLYILSDKLHIYEFVNNKLEILNNKKYDQLLLEYKDLIVYDKSDITLLYKRKYDNVQEYMERKKLRLEAK